MCENLYVYQKAKEWLQSSIEKNVLIIHIFKILLHNSFKDGDQTTIRVFNAPFKKNKKPLHTQLEISIF